MKKIAGRASLLILVGLGLILSGCSDEFWDPTQVGRFRPTPAVNVILDSIGISEGPPSAWEGSEDPRPVDLVVFEQDYVISPGDYIRVYIFELLQVGAAYVNEFQVTETGKISIPDIGTVQAAGLSESQLESEIRGILSPSILKDPVISVLLINSQRRTFSILGQGVPASGRYEIPRSGFRLTEALATAGGMGQFNISNIYVSRAVTGDENLSEPQIPGQNEFQVPQGELFEVIGGRGADQIITGSELATDEELAGIASPEGFQTLARNEPAEPKEARQLDLRDVEKELENHRAGRIEWVFEDGRWIPKQVGGPDEKTPEQIVAREPEPIEEDNFSWEQVGSGGQTARVIRIPADRLRGGDPRYNIVIRPGDSIHVPVDIIGEFYIQGNVNRQGLVELTGRPMTLKMAIAAAGGLGPLAWPERCEVVRRVGQNKEEIVMVDLKRIASGEQPDFFIKPNDLINVGTHPTARWRATVRNAFRATYGFGFLYDRNFADRDFGTSRPFGSIF